MDDHIDDSHAVTLWTAGLGDTRRDLKPGDIIGGSYRLKSLLGKGGMGYVFCAEHIMIGRDYALKMLAADRLNDVSRRRFETEGRAIANLDHPNIVKVHNMGLDAGSPFYVMDLLDGVALSDCIDPENRMDYYDCLDVFIQIAAGLGYAHGKGIIHRDVKPSNVVLLASDNGQVSAKIVDFGIAKLVNAQGFEGQSQTATGEVFGSPYYMSPEQCMGTGIDARSDIYSLGCSLFEVLAGRPPFGGGNAMETVLMHQNAPVPSISKVCPQRNLPPGVDLLLGRMMAKRPSERYQSMPQLIHDLGRLREGRPIGKMIVGENGNEGAAEDSSGAPEEPTMAPAADFRKTAFGLAGVAGVCLVLGAGLLFYFGNAKKPNPVDVAAAPPAVVSTAAATTSGAMAKIDELDMDTQKLVPSAQNLNNGHSLFTPAEMAAAKRVFAGCPIIRRRKVIKDGAIMREINFPPVSVGLVSTKRHDETEARGTVTLQDHDICLAARDSECLSIQNPVIFSRFAPDVIHSLRLTGKRFDLYSVAPSAEDGCTDKLREILLSVAKWSDLRFISLNSFTVDNSVLKVLNALPDIEHLELHNVTWQVSPEAKGEIFGRVEEVQLDQMLNAGGFCKYLAHSTALRKIKIDHSAIKGQEFAQLASCPRLKAVELSSISVDDQLIAEIVKMGSIEYVRCTAIQLTPLQLKLLGSCHHLSEVSLDVTSYEPAVRREYGAMYHILQFGEGKKSE